GRRHEWFHKFDGAGIISVGLARRDTARRWIEVTHHRQGQVIAELIKDILLIGRNARSARRRRLKQPIAREDSVGWNSDIQVPLGSLAWNHSVAIDYEDPDVVIAIGVPVTRHADRRRCTGKLEIDLNQILG